jgi:hypothetical protein
MITIPYSDSKGRSFGGQYYFDNIFVKGGHIFVGPSYAQWVEQHGGKVVLRFLEPERRIKIWMLEFEDEQDAIVFKLKYV